MIQVREDIVWVVTAGGEMEVFDAARLVRSILRVVPAGQEPEFADVSRAITDAVRQHLRDNLGPEPVTTARIGEMVQALLEMLGYRDVARRYGGEAALTEIRLDQIATDADSGGAFELGFYRRLDEAMTVASRSGPTQVQMRGLRTCVLRLRGARRWGRSCRELAEEIMAHVWARAAQLPRTDGAVVQLAVME